MYDVNYHKSLNQTHILPNILNGAISGIASQFIADIILSFLLYQDELLINDIETSEVASYYASAITGMALGFLAIYMDSYAVILFSTVIYEYSFQLIDKKLKIEEIEVDSKSIVFDSIFTLIMVYSFDPTSHEKYIRYRDKKNLIEPRIPRHDREDTLALFFIIISATYGYLKKKKKNTMNKTLCL